jgi:Ala-tRNA(Pro) deacylase
MIPNNLTYYLDSNRVKYITLTHSPAYTSQEIAASAHIPGRSLAKTVLVKADGKLVMVVLPANYKIKFDLLKKALGAKEVRLAYEQEFKDKFPDCEVGAMPPFGNLYNMDVYVAGSLADDFDIAFNACTHNNLIKMGFRDFQKLVQPKIIEFTYPTRL